jgi:hypothetical protein
MNEVNKGSPFSVSADAPIAIEGSPVTGRLAAALLAGLLAALAGGIVWAVITVQTRYQLGFMAIGLGLLVGFAVRKVGGGNTAAFAVIGAVCALLGCLLGNLLSASGFYAEAQDRSVVLVVAQLMDEPDRAVKLMQATFNPIDLLFYAIAVFAAYKLSRRPRW